MTTTLAAVVFWTLVAAYAVVVGGGVTLYLLVALAPDETARFLERLSRRFGPDGED